MSFLQNKNSLKINKDSDKKFLDDYYSRYQSILFDSRDDNSILKLRNAINETNINKGKLIFIGNGASASLDFAYSSVLFGLNCFCPRGVSACGSGVVC